jgi:hypothetical protein
MLRRRPQKKTPAPVSAKTTPAPVSAKTTPAPVSAKKTPAPVSAKKTPAPVSAKQNATPVSAKQNATPVSAEKSNSKDVSTGVKYNDQEVFHTPDLKNPLSGFYTKTADGKKQQIVLAAIDTNIANSLKATLKKKNATPPPGKTVNPKTGRFVKEVNTKVEKDPSAC